MLRITRDSNIGAEVIDLGTVLRQQRQCASILVAEDNKTNQTIIRQLLESAGHTVVLASDGEEALDKYETEVPDVAILDFNMPERNGIEVVSAIRTMEPTGRRLPIILLSASVTVESRAKARQAGADEFIGKPFDAARLLERIDELVRAAGIRRSPGMKRADPARAATVTLGAVPLLDTRRIAEVEQIASSPDFFDRLLGGFVEDVRSLLRRLDSAVTSGDMDVVRDIAHAIKGAALGVGAQQLASRSTSLESAAAVGDIGNARARVKELTRCFNDTLEQLNGYSRERARKLV